MPTLTELRPEYERLFTNSIINNDKFNEIDKIAEAIISNKTRYELIGGPMDIPWYFIGIIHSLECNLNFTKHLYNGDPLSARTIHVPKGLPNTAQPPFSFEESATAALKYDGFDKIDDWSVAGQLFLFEKYNGFGYRKKSINIPSPYLWSYSNQYIKGKYASDGAFDPSLVSKQAGAATILRRLAEKQAIDFRDLHLNRIKAIKDIGKNVVYAPSRINDSAMRLQELLNAVGFPLRRDGKAGEKTSTAFKQVSGKYISGDPRLQ